MEGTIARPSRPSVRFTALDEPIITSAPSTGRSGPSGISTSLNTGTASPPESAGGIREVIQSAQARPITACTESFIRPDTPRWFRLVTFSQSSAKPSSP